jgi:hypothetical protein
MRLQKSGLLIEVNTTLSVAEELTGPFLPTLVSDGLLDDSEVGVYTAHPRGFERLHFESDRVRYQGIQWHGRTHKRRHGPRAMVGFTLYARATGLGSGSSAYRVGQVRPAGPWQPGSS